MLYLMQNLFFLDAPWQILFIDKYKCFLLTMPFLFCVFLAQPCSNPTCLYLHTIGADEDSFGKDEVAAVHTRYNTPIILYGIEILSFSLGYLHIDRNWGLCAHSRRSKSPV